MLVLAILKCFPIGRSNIDQRRRTGGGRVGSELRSTGMVTEGRETGRVSGEGERVSEWRDRVGGRERG